MVIAAYILFLYQSVLDVGKRGHDMTKSATNHRGNVRAFHVPGKWSP